MTENKRFTLHKGLDTLSIMDNTKFNEHIYINKSSKDMKFLVGVLNAQHEEIEELKSENKELIELIRHCYENWSEEKKKMVGEISNGLVGDFND